MKKLFKKLQKTDKAINDSATSIRNMEAWDNKTQYDIFDLKNEKDFYRRLRVKRVAILQDIKVAVMMELGETNTDTNATAA